MGHQKLADVLHHTTIIRLQEHAYTTVQRSKTPTQTTKSMDHVPADQLTHTVQLIRPAQEEMIMLQLLVPLLVVEWHLLH